MFSVRLVTADSYQAQPLPRLDPTFSEFRGSEIKHVPIVRVFGATPTGEKTCLHIHGVFPYLYVPYTGEEEPASLAYRLAASLDAAINVSLGSATSNTQHVYSIQRVSGIPFYGYHKKEHQFLKIHFYSPAMMKRGADLLQNGSVLNQSLQPHEAHIPYILQFMMDYNVYGMSMINMSSVKHRRETQSLAELGTSVQSVTSESSEIEYLPTSVERQSTCKLEIDALACDILNRRDIESGLDLNPGLAAIWDEERARRFQAGFEGGDSQLVNPKSPSRPTFQPTDNDIYQEQRLNRRLLILSQCDESTLSATSNQSVAYAAEVRDDENLLNSSCISIPTVKKTSQENPIESMTFLDSSSIVESQKLSQDCSVRECYSNLMKLDQKSSISNSYNFSLVGSDDMSLVDLLAELAGDESRDKQESVDMDSLLGSQASILLNDDEDEDVPDLNLTCLQLDSLSSCENIRNSGEQRKESSVCLQDENSLSTVHLSPFLTPREDEENTLIPQYDGAGDLSPNCLNSSSSNNDDEPEKIDEKSKDFVNADNGTFEVSLQSRETEIVTINPTEFPLEKMPESLQTYPNDYCIIECAEEIVVSESYLGQYSEMNDERYDNFLEIGQDFNQNLEDMHSSMENEILCSNVDSDSTESVCREVENDAIPLDAVLNGDPCFTESAEVDKSDVTELRDQYASLLGNSLLPDVEINSGISENFDSSFSDSDYQDNEKTRVIREASRDSSSSSENVTPNIQDIPDSKHFSKNKSNNLKELDANRDNSDYNRNFVVESQNIREDKRLYRLRNRKIGLRQSRKDDRSMPDITSQLYSRLSENTNTSPRKILSRSPSKSSLKKSRNSTSSPNLAAECASLKKVFERVEENLSTSPLKMPVLMPAFHRSIIGSDNALAKTKTELPETENLVDSAIPEVIIPEKVDFSSCPKIEILKRSSYYCSMRSENSISEIGHLHCSHTARGLKIVKDQKFLADELYVIEKRKQGRQVLPDGKICTKKCKIPIVFLKKMNKIPMITQKSSQEMSDEFVEVESLTSPISLIERNERKIESKKLPERKSREKRLTKISTDSSTISSSSDEESSDWAKYENPSAIRKSIKEEETREPYNMRKTMKSFAVKKNPQMKESKSRKPLKKCRDLPGIPGIPNYPKKRGRSKNISVRSVENKKRKVSKSKPLHSLLFSNWGAQPEIVENLSNGKSKESSNEKILVNGNKRKGRSLKTSFSPVSPLSKINNKLSSASSSPTKLSLNLSNPTDEIVTKTQKESDEEAALISMICETKCASTRAKLKLLKESSKLSKSNKKKEEKSHKDERPSVIPTKPKITTNKNDSNPDKIQLFYDDMKVIIFQRAEKKDNETLLETDRISSDTIIEDENTSEKKKYSDLDVSNGELAIHESDRTKNSDNSALETLTTEFETPGLSLVFETSREIIDSDKEFLETENLETKQVSSRNDRYAINETEFSIGNNYTIEAVSHQIPTCLFEEDSNSLPKESVGNDSRNLEDSHLSANDSASGISIDPCDLDVYDVESLTSNSSLSHLSDEDTMYTVLNIAGTSENENLDVSSNSESFGNRDYSTHGKTRGGKVAPSNLEYKETDDYHSEEDSPEYEALSPDPKISETIIKSFQEQFDVGPKEVDITKNYEKFKNASDESEDSFSEVVEQFNNKLNLVDPSGIIPTFEMKVQLLNDTEYGITPNLTMSDEDSKVSNDKQEDPTVSAKTNSEVAVNDVTEEKEVEEMEKAEPAIEPDEESKTLDDEELPVATEEDLQPEIEDIEADLPTTNEEQSGKPENNTEAASIDKQEIVIIEKDVDSKCKLEDEEISKNLQQFLVFPKKKMLNIVRNEGFLEAIESVVNSMIEDDSETVSIDRELIETVQNEGKVSETVDKEFEENQVAHESQSKENQEAENRSESNNSNEESLPVCETNEPMILIKVGQIDRNMNESGVADAETDKHEERLLNVSKERRKPKKALYFDKPSRTRRNKLIRNSKMNAKTLESSPELNSVSPEYYLPPRKMRDASSTLKSKKRRSFVEVSEEILIQRETIDVPEQKSEEIIDTKSEQKIANEISQKLLLKVEEAELSQFSLSPEKPKKRGRPRNSSNPNGNDSGKSCKIISKEAAQDPKFSPQKLIHHNVEPEIPVRLERKTRSQKILSADSEKASSQIKSLDEMPEVKNLIKIGRPRGSRNKLVRLGRPRKDRVRDETNLEYPVKIRKSGRHRINSVLNLENSLYPSSSQGKSVDEFVESEKPVKLRSGRTLKNSEVNIENSSSSQEDSTDEFVESIKLLKLRKSSRARKNSGMNLESSSPVYPSSQEESSDDSVKPVKLRKSDRAQKNSSVNIESSSPISPPSQEETADESDSSEYSVKQRKRGRSPKKLSSMEDLRSNIDEASSEKSVSPVQKILINVNEKKPVRRSCRKKLLLEMPLLQQENDNVNVVKTSQEFQLSQKEVICKDIEENICTKLKIKSHRRKRVSANAQTSPNDYSADEESLTEIMEKSTEESDSLPPKLSPQININENIEPKSSPQAESSLQKIPYKNVKSKNQESNRRKSCRQIIPVEKQFPQEEIHEKYTKNSQIKIVEESIQTTTMIKSIKRFYVSKNLGKNIRKSFLAESSNEKKAPRKTLKKSSDEESNCSPKNRINRSNPKKRIRLDENCASLVSKKSTTMSKTDDEDIDDSTLFLSSISLSEFAKGINGVKDHIKLKPNNSFNRSNLSSLQNLRQLNCYEDPETQNVIYRDENLLLTNLKWTNPSKSSISSTNHQRWNFTHATTILQLKEPKIVLHRLTQNSFKTNSKSLKPKASKPIKNLKKSSSPEVFNIPAYDGAADLSSTDSDEDKDVTIAREEKCVCIYKSGKKSSSSRDTIATPKKRRLDEDSEIAGPSAKRRNQRISEVSKKSLHRSPSRQSMLKSPGRLSGYYSPLKIIVTSPKVRKETSVTRETINLEDNACVTPKRDRLHDNMMRGRIVATKSSINELGEELVPAANMDSERSGELDFIASSETEDATSMNRGSKDVRKKLLFSTTEKNRGLEKSSDSVEESNRSDERNINLTTINDTQASIELSKISVNLQSKTRIIDPMENRDPYEVTTDEDDEECNVTFSQFIDTQINKNKTLLDRSNIDTQINENTVLIRPKFNPPTRRNVVETMETYGIPKYRNQEPFFSVDADVSKQKELAHKMLKVPGKSLKDTPAFVSSVEGVTGINRWRRMKVMEFNPSLARSKDNDMKIALGGNEKMILKPLGEPPTRKEVKDWLRAREYLSKKRKQEEEDSKRTEIRTKTENSEDFSNDLSVVNEFPVKIGMKEEKTLSCGSEVRFVNKGLLKKVDEIVADKTRKDSEEETDWQKAEESGEARRGSGDSNSTEMDRSLLSVLAKSRLFREQETSRRLGVSCGQIEFLSDSTRSNVANENLRNAKALTRYQYLTIMCLEVHVTTRGDLLPDAQYDSIAALFYSVQSDVPPTSSIKPLEHGVIILADSDRAKNRMYYSYASNVPWSITFAENEEALLNSLVNLITRVDPEILIGWELETLSWGYVFQRASNLGLNIYKRVSRIPATQGKWETQQRDMEKLSEVKLPGRIVLDIWRLMRHEAALLSYTFESMMHHVLNERIPCPSFKTLTDWWNLERPRPSRWKVVEHYSVRVLGVLRILDQLDIIGRTSELARLFGIQFFEVFSRGSQYRVESVMLRLAKPLNYIAVSPSPQQRASMRAMEALPLIMEPESMFYSDPLIVLDFQSLYPSIIIAHNICFSTCLGRIEHIGQPQPFEFGAYTLRVPKSTSLKLQGKVNYAPCGVAFVKPEVRLGILPRMLTEILETRFMVKKAMKDHKKDDKTLQRALHSRQMGLKFLANVTYGYTAANFSGRMPCIEVGDSVISKSKETLERAIKLVESTPKWGARVVYGDTDSLFILVPGKSKADAFVIGNEIADAVTQSNPPPIKLKFEKVVYPAILQTKKRYCGYMYETPEQESPTYLAKGIETVRRDGCPAVSKILEKTLKILFETKDVSLVKKYVTRQLDKVLRGKVSIQDLTFAKEFRGLKGYKPKACVPPLELTKRLMKKDPRAVPRVSERVRYVIVAGAPNQALIHCVRTPWELMNDPGLRPNAIYYVTRVIIPPLNRCLNLMGVDVNDWYREMPHRHILNNPVAQPGDKQKLTIFQYFGTIVCAVCGQSSNKGVCMECLANPADALVVIYEKLRRLDRTHCHVTSICQSCVGRPDIVDCASLDCPVLYRRAQAQRELTQTTHLRSIIDCGNNLEL